MNIRRIYYLFNKIDMHWYLCKEDLNIQLKLPKCVTYVFIHDSDKNLSSFDCTLLDLAVTCNFAFIKLAAKFIRSTLSFKDKFFLFLRDILFKINSVFYSQYPRAFKRPCVITVDINRSIGISKQSYLPVCIHVDLIDQLSAYQFHSYAYR